MHFSILAFFNIPGLFESFAENLAHALSVGLYYDHHDLDVQESITKQIKEFYFDNHLTREKKSNVTNVIFFYINQIEKKIYFNKLNFIEWGL